MNFSQCLIILRARYKIILLVLAMTMLAALIASLLAPKTYKASTKLVINYKGMDPVTGIALPSQLMPGFMATQADIIKNMTTALSVVDELKLTHSPATQKKFMAATKGKRDIREWQAELLLKKLDVAPSRESSILNISFSASDPQFAAQVANTFANAYQKISIQLKVDPAKKAALYFNEQIKQLRDNFEAAQNKVTRYQQENGIVNPDSRADLETSRLNELSSQLAVAQAQTVEAASRRHQAQGSGAGESPDVAENPLIQQIKMQLSTAETTLNGVAQTFTENHPRYQTAKAEVNKLRAELNSQIRASSNSIANNARILERRESNLRAAVEEQKAKVLEANRKRGELQVLSNEMERAQKSYEEAAQRFTQANFEGQSNQTDIALLTAALPPAKADSPSLLLNVLLSAFFGLVLGAGFAMLAEIRDRRIRSTYDLMSAIQAPVLGVMDWMEPKRQRLGLSNLLLSYRSSPN